MSKAVTQKKTIKVTSPEIPMKKKMQAVTLLQDNQYDFIKTAKQLGVSAALLELWNNELGVAVSNAREERRVEVLASEMIAEIEKTNLQTVGIIKKSYLSAIERLDTVLQSETDVEVVAKAVDVLTRAVKELREASEGGATTGKKRTRMTQIMGNQYNQHNHYHNSKNGNNKTSGN